MPKRKYDSDESDYNNLCRKMKRLKKKLKRKRRHSRHSDSVSEMSPERSHHNHGSPRDEASYYEDRDFETHTRSDQDYFADLLDDDVEMGYMETETVKSKVVVAPIITTESPVLMTAASTFAGPSAAPTAGLSAAPTAGLSAAPTADPSAAPAAGSSAAPTAAAPSAAPTAAPSAAPGAAPSATPSAVPSAAPAVALSHPESTAPDAVEVTSVLDPELLLILGEDPSIVNEYGKSIQKDLAIRLGHIATTGLTKEARKELKEKYLVPENCKAIGAPVLNPEISANMLENHSKRDKGIELKQSMTAAAISSLSEAISVLLSSESKDPGLLKLLMDTARIICDCQHSDSVTRRSFILFNLKKDMKAQMEKTKIANFLFGPNLSDTLKTAKAISRSGADLKTNPTNRPPPPQNRNYPTNSQQNKPQTSLNWRGPPQSRKPIQAAGAQRTTRPPTQRRQQANSSKTSSRPANNTYRTRL